ncbi:MAG: hypothetical protein U0Y68_27330 [Blastocatellia bacterium]
MAAPYLSHVPVRRAPSFILQRVYYGAPSCSPLLQHHLLLALREIAPQMYARLVAETGLTVDKTQVLVERKSMISAAGSLMIFRLIACEELWREILQRASESLMASLYCDLPFSLKFALNNLPRQLRVRLALTLLERKMPHVAGSNSKLISYNRRGSRLYVQVKDGLFADLIETRAGAREFYSTLLRAMFWHFSRVNCQLSEVRSQLILAHECWYAIEWDS